ncbi:MAG: hypothetical protein AAGF22_03660 [Pseudomonadota bacterium]
MSSKQPIPALFFFHYGVYGDSASGSYGGDAAGEGQRTKDEGEG